jgi:hypothetical protein
VASSAAAGVLLAGGAVIGIALTGGASAATGSPAASTSSSAGSCQMPATGLRHGGHRAAARRVAARRHLAALRVAAAGGLYGQITFKGKNCTRTLAFERGTVESVSGSAVTVQAADGVAWTWDLVAGTVVRESGHAVAPSTLASGERVLVVGPILNGTKDARFVRIKAAG